MKYDVQKRGSSKTAGFTLMEVLVVIGVLAILAAIVVVALNPARHFAQARNTQREANVATILNAIGQNVVDNKGTFTCSGVTIDTSTSTIGSGSGNKNLASCLVPTYIPTTVPVDPDGGTDADTGYKVLKDSVGRFSVCAPKHAESAITGSAEYCLVQ
jgi:prepilin-type N-terminal cleavage/methylation domain-containing protein